MLFSAIVTDGWVDPLYLIQFTWHPDFLIYSYSFGVTSTNIRSEIVSIHFKVWSLPPSLHPLLSSFLPNSLHWNYPMKCLTFKNQTFFFLFRIQFLIQIARSGPGYNNPITRRSLISFNWNLKLRRHKLFTTIYFFLLIYKEQKKNAWYLVINPKINLIFSLYPGKFVKSIQSIREISLVEI